MAIGFADQYFVERDRGYMFQYLSMLITILLPVIHGALFHWIPWRLRHRRDRASLKNQRYFTFVKYFDSLTRVYGIQFFNWKFYVQPSLLLIMAFHIVIHVVFAFLQTKDLNYLPRFYIVAKRFGRLAISNIPSLMIFVAHNNFIAAVSGLSLDKAVFFHKWLGRWMFIECTIHMGLSLQYWLSLGFYIMIQIPPQIFGFIAYSALGMLTFASFKFIRNFAFDFFLAQHKFFSFIMLLLGLFHNGANRLTVILGVHLLVLDRVVLRIMGFIHKRKSPTKGVTDFEILDETTIRVSIPIAINNVDNRKWWRTIVPRYGNWRAGQHIYLTVPKVSFFQAHPFTIASLQDSGKMVVVMKVLKGFTRNLNKRLIKMSNEAGELYGDLSKITEISNDSFTKPETNDKFYESDSKSIKIETEYEVKSTTPSEKEIRELLTMFPSREILTLKSGIVGPMGGNYQPLTKFESVLFFSAGTGASFTLPVALDLLKENRERDLAEDFLYRPELTKITIVMSMKKFKNLEWYDHLWEEFIPFMISGKLHLILHITQEISDAADVASEIDCQERQYKEKNSSTSENESIYLTSSSSIADQTGFSIVHGRPIVHDYITKAIQEQSSMSYRKAFACLGCGPHAFNGDIKNSCEKNKWETGAPLVYCYTESFG